MSDLPTSLKTTAGGELVRDGGIKCPTPTGRTGHGELFQAGRGDLAGREERKTRGKVVEQLVVALRHTDGCSHTSMRAWIQDMDLATERVGQNGIVDCTGGATPRIGGIHP